MMKAVPYILTFATALGGTLLLTPLVEQLAIKFGVIDKPDYRKVHSKPTPRWGGLAIVVSMILPLILVFLTFEQVQVFLSERMKLNLAGLLIGGILMVILGMIDDKYNLSAKCKLLGQIVIAVILIKFGIAITFLNIPFYGFVFLTTWQSWLISLIWIIGLTNAINLLDGLDGLLAGVSVIFALLFFTIAILKGQYVVAMVMMSLAGASLGFLRYNFSPASIFMGDSGSLFLGMMYASLSIMGALKVTTTAALLIPIMIMGLPIFDTSFAIFRRFANGRPIFSPDKEHVHHQLLAKGMTVRQAVIFIYVICGTLGIIGLSIAFLIR